MITRILGGWGLVLKTPAHGNRFEKRPQPVCLQVCQVKEVKVLLKLNALRLVADRNCVAARRGGNNAKRTASPQRK